MNSRTSSMMAALAALVVIGCQAAAPPATPPAPEPVPTTTAGMTSAPTTTATATTSESNTGTTPESTTGSATGTTTGTTTGPTTGPTTSAPVPAGASSPTPPPEARLAAPAEAHPVEVLEALALVPGASTPLKLGEQITVDPGATFRVVLKGTYLEARLSLLDGGDAMAAGAGAREAGPTTTVTLQPAAPLKPGSSYRLRVDGATTRELRAADGSARAPVEFPVLAAGEPPPEPKARPKRAKKRP